MRQMFNQLLVVKRFKLASGNKQHLVATATADCSIQPLGKDRQNFSDGVFGSTFVAYLEPHVDVRKGDQVKDSNGTIYSVNDVVERDFGAFPFKEIIIKKTT